jgi:hypothetical protein
MDVKKTISDYLEVYDFADLTLNDLAPKARKLPHCTHQNELMCFNFGLINDSR